jgi:hypothetical protein
MAIDTALEKNTIALGNGASRKPEGLTAWKPSAHTKLDTIFAVMLAIIAAKLSDPKAFLKSFFNAFRHFDLYTPQFDWKKKPMSKSVGVATLVTAWYFLIRVYVVEKRVLPKDNAIDQAHKKYKAHKNMWAVVAHGAGSSLELTIGCFACIYPEKTLLTKISSALAINNVLTGFVLTPGVFGIKHLTVPGFALFGCLRSIEIARTLGQDYRNYPQAWILLQVGTIVRLLGYWVLPFSSIDGKRGDLFTEPTMYSFNILLSGYLTAAFVYPPKHVLASLLLYVLWHYKQPPRISMRRRLCFEIQDKENTTKDIAPLAAAGA